MWNYIETFYREQGTEYTHYATEKYLNNIATQIPGLNPKRWHTDRRTGRRSEAIAEDDHTARTIGFHDTPSFLFGHTNRPLKAFTGKRIIAYIGQTHPVSLVSLQDPQNAIHTLQHA